METVIPVKGRVAIDMRAREWCKLSYPNHRHGCPNYGMKKTCPPQAPLVNKHFDLGKRHWLGIVDFDLEAHVERMREKHPDWTDRQLRCVLYWQGAVNKRLRELTVRFHKQNKGTIYTMCPEAMGMHVLKTMRRQGYDIRKNPTEMVYKVSLIGYPK